MCCKGRRCCNEAGMDEPVSLFSYGRAAVVPVLLPELLPKRQNAPKCRCGAGEAEEVPAFFPNP